jgi:acetylornithine deacetylase/succinyl-diaminopimelate desuccinylase-like protein
MVKTGERGMSDAALIDLLMELVRIPGTAGEEGAVAQFLGQLLPQFGWDEVTVDDNHNVVARARGNGTGPSVMLLIHSDSAQAGTMANPYEPVFQDGAAFGKQGDVVYGRGSTAPKASIASMIAATARILADGQRLPGDLILAVITRDLLANNDGIRDIDKQGVKADFVIVGEPSDNQIVLGARGVAQYDVTITGIPAHVGNPDGGVNPIPLMATFLTDIEQLPRDEHPQLGKFTLAPLSVSGVGTRPNTPEQCTAVVDHRVLPGGDPAEMGKRLQEIATRAAARDERATVKVELLRSMLSFEIAPGAPIVQALLTASQETGHRAPNPGYIRFATNAGYAVAHWGAQAVGFGPGLIGDVGAQEHVEVAAVHEAAQVYERAVRLLSSGQ